MRNGLAIVVVLAGVFAAALTADAADAIGLERASVQVRLYAGAVMPAAEQTVALRAATGVLAAAGIDISWLVCGDAGSSANPPGCDAPLARDALAVRLVRLAGSPSARGKLQLGYSLVDLRAMGGTLATVYVDRVHWLASQGRCPGPQGCGCDAATLLGFAVAHEIGHLLLGTNAHAVAGLMRAVWSRTEVQRRNPADWLFTPDEGLAMIRRLRQRQERVQMAAHIVSGR